MMESDSLSFYLGKVLKSIEIHDLVWKWNSWYGDNTAMFFLCGVIYRELEGCRRQQEDKSEDGRGQHKLNKIQSKHVGFSPGPQS